MARIVGLAVVPVTRRAPPNGVPGESLQPFDDQEIQIAGEDFGHEEGDGETPRSMQGIYVAHRRPVRIQLNLDITAVGAFLDPVDVSDLAEVTITGPEWVMDGTPQVELAVVFD